MATIDSVMTKLRNLLSSLSTKMGTTYSTFTAAINALPSKKTQANVSVSGKTVTAPAGIYFSQVQGSVSDSYIIPSGTKTISSSGTHDVKAYASASVAAGSATTPATTITANPSIATTATTVTAGKAYKMSVSGSKSITPTVTKGYIESGTAGTVTVSGEAYVMESSTGSATTSSTTTTATRTIGYNQETTISAGYYPSARIIRNSVAAGKATTPATTITKTPSISVNSSGVISASVSGTQSVTPSVTAGYVSSGTAGTITVSGSATKKATDLDANLVAGNIKKNVKIFGVTGSYEGGASVGTCTVKLGIGSMDWYTNNNVRVFYTSYSGGAFNTNVVQTSADATSTITLSNVVCGSAISVWTQVYAYISPSTYTKYTDEYNHCLMCPNSPGQTVTIDLLENS